VKSNPSSNPPASLSFPSGRETNAFSQAGGEHLPAGRKR
jgi:hypothetical protein